MRLDLFLVVFAAAICTLCAPLSSELASRSDALISGIEHGTHKRISEREDSAGGAGLEAGIDRETDVNKRFALSDLGNTLFNGAFGGPPTNKGVTQKLRGKTSPNEPFRFDVTE